MVVSRSGVRSVSMASSLVAMGCSAIVASTIVPVSPMPPQVAQNWAGFASGVSVVQVPSGRATTIDRTCRPKLPEAWWSLPCTSAAMAPPIVM
jgi:hypothetical protein